MSSVSILIVGYHAYDELEACLASIDRHEPDVEVLVVDHDADAARGRALAAHHPRVRYLPRQHNPGFGAGVNDAARHAHGHQLLILNPDVVLQAPVSAILAATLAANPQAGLVGGLLHEADGSVQASARSFPDWTTAFGGRTSWLTRLAPSNPLTRRNLAQHDQPLKETTVVDWVTGAFVMTRRDVFEAIGGFDERFFLYWEDADLCRRALDAGWQTLFEPAASLVHLTARASRHAPGRSLVAFHRSAFRYYWKHTSALGRLAAPLVAAGLAVRLVLRARTP